jgi:NADH dehydrogenase (ubiquinone) 1 beta subcomplex subunit 7
MEAIINMIHWKGFRTAVNLEVTLNVLSFIVNCLTDHTTSLYRIYYKFFLEIKTTLEEMESARIPLDKRDYCVDYLMKYLGCRSEKYPWVYRCHHEKHEYLHCQYEEYVFKYFIK